MMRARIHLSGGPRRQRGVVLFIALIVLVAMTLGGIAIMRSVDTNTLIAGNLAFKQSALQASDQGVEQAFQWLLANRSTLANTNLPEAYKSAYVPENWNDAATWTGAKILATDVTGNTVSYLIHRMCKDPDKAYNGPGQECVLDIPAGAPPPPKEGDSFVVGAPRYLGEPKVYYRITARTIGPRQTTTLVQAMVVLSL